MTTNKASISQCLKSDLVGLGIGSDWVGLGMDSWRLWNDAATVMWLRGAAIAKGGAPAAREAERMVSEKLEANAAFAIDVAMGSVELSPHAMASRALGHYGPKVRANRRRLMRTARG